MKIRFIRMLAVCAALLMVLVFAGCPHDPPDYGSTDSSGSQTGNISFIFKSMPEDYYNYNAKILCYDNQDNLLETVNLGKVKEEQQTFRGNLHPDTAGFWAVLSNYANVNHYGIYRSCGSQFASQYTLDKYWRILNNTGNDAPLFTLSEDYLETITLDTDITYTFDAAPFYFLRIPDANSKKYVITCSDTDNVSVFYDDFINSMLSQTYMSEVNVPGTKKVTCYGDELYLLLRPDSYAYTQESPIVAPSITIHVTDLDHAVQNSVTANTIREVHELSSNELIFAGDDGSQTNISTATPSLATGKNLYSYNYQTNTLTTIKECENYVKYITPFDNGFLFASGNSVWYYDKTTKTTTVKCAASSIIDGLSLIENNELLLIEKYSNGSGAGNASIYSTTSWSKVKSGASYPGFDSAQSLVYIPEMKRVFYLNQGSSPRQIKDIWYNEDQELIVTTLVDTSNDSSRNYSLLAPIKRWGSENAVIVGTGRVFSIEGELQTSDQATHYMYTTQDSPYLTIDETKTLSISFSDIEFTDEYFYTVSNYENKYTVRKFSLNDRLNPVEEYSITGYKGIELIMHSDEILVVSTALEPIETGTDANHNYVRYYPIKVTKFNFDLTLKN